jgi:hypothetical protein
MNRKSFSQLAKVKGARTPAPGAAAIQGTFTGGRVPATGKGTDPLKGPRGARRR